MRIMRMLLLFLSRAVIMTLIVIAQICPLMSVLLILTLIPMLDLPLILRLTLLLTLSLRRLPLHLHPSPNLALSSLITIIFLLTRAGA